VAEFIVDKSGMVTEPVIKQGIGSGCDEETIRLLKAMPAWSPGMQDGTTCFCQDETSYCFPDTKGKTEGVISYQPSAISYQLKIKIQRVRVQNPYPLDF
jgi:hypothetical protein